MRRIGHAIPVKALLLCMSCAFCSAPAERAVDPTFLYRSVAAVPAASSELTTASCRYKPVFGVGDKDRQALVGIARYGEADLDGSGACASTQHEDEDQVYVVLEGAGSVKYGDQIVALRKEDYLYVPAGIRGQLRSGPTGPMQVIIMGFRTKGFEKAPLPNGPMKANIGEVRTQPVSGHPLSALYRLLMGDADSKRDRIAAGRVLTSLFVMEIAPGGTNFPHHHEREEEIYLVLAGGGDMVAGGGTTGIEGRHPAKAGDAYFFRLNATVGYYSAPGVRSRILAVRSWYPGMVTKGMEH